MTLIGVWADQDRAMCWADTEGHLRDKFTRRIVASTGHHMKLAFNERAIVAAAGAGDAGGNRRIAEAVDFAQSFDEFCFGLPRLWNDCAVDRIDAHCEWPDWICVAAGFSQRLRCMVGAMFSAADKFVVKIGKSFMMPHVTMGSDLINLVGPADLVPVAQKQMNVLQHSNPLAGGGTLTIAEIRRGSVSTAAFDIPSGAPLAALPNIPKMGAYLHDAVCMPLAGVEASGPPAAARRNAAGGNFSNERS